MTPQEIKDLRELEKKATPGPWEIECENVGDEASCYAPAGVVGSNGFPVISPEGGLAPAGCEWRVSTLKANAQLITAMRNALPELLDWCELVQALNGSQADTIGQLRQDLAASQEREQEAEEKLEGHRDDGRGFAG